MLSVYADEAIDRDTLPRNYAYEDVTKIEVLTGQIRISMRDEIRAGFQVDLATSSVGNV